MQTLWRHGALWQAIFLLPVFLVTLSAAPASIGAETFTPKLEASGTVSGDWTGRFCPISGCVPVRGGPVSHATGFAVTILGILWLAGRRNPAHG